MKLTKRFKLFLKENEAYDEYCENLLKFEGCKFKEYVAGNMYSILNAMYILYNSFKWEDTEQGKEFWTRLDKKWVEELHSKFTRKAPKKIKNDDIIGFVDRIGGKGIIIYVGTDTKCITRRFVAINLLEHFNVSNSFYGVRDDLFQTQADCAEYLEEEYDAHFRVFSTPEDRLKWLLED